MKMFGNNKRVLVGFSGGVDSAAAALILKEKGFEPMLLHLKFLPEEETAGLREFARKFGFEYKEKDVSREFEAKIIDYFSQEYLHNKTPNPCVKCNLEMKFQFLLEAADKMGVQKIATGHYARVERNKENQCFELKRGIDQGKDQSYFLYRLTQKELSRSIFPLGDKNKNQVKKELEKKGIFPVKEESQDVCFFAREESLEDFISKRIYSRQSEGEIIDREGNVLGKHKGLIYYTRGQRKGLGIGGGGGPYYVVDKDFEKNRLVVADNLIKKELFDNKITFSKTNWICKESEKGKLYAVNSRYRSKPSAGYVQKRGEQTWEVSLKEPQFAPASGQSLVVYDQDRVVGGGIID
jgi:tRNA-specific 2-thiouridylase